MGAARRLVVLGEANNHDDDDVPTASGGQPPRRVGPASLQTAMTPAETVVVEPPSCFRAPALSSGRQPPQLETGRRTTANMRRTQMLQTTPYRRNMLTRASSTEITGETSSPIRGVVAKIKGVVGWLLSGLAWNNPSSTTPETATVTSPDLGRRPTEEGVAAVLRERLALSRTMSGDSETDQLKDHYQTRELSVSMDIDRSDTIGRRHELYRHLVDPSRQPLSRPAIYAEMARFFRYCSQQPVLLTREEYEELSLLIQRQGTRRRLPLEREGEAATVTVPSVPAETDLVLSTSQADTTVLPPPVPSPEKAISVSGKSSRHSARVFSARFDEDGDEDELVRGRDGRRRIAPMHVVISDNRKRLIEEARRRVAEQIRRASATTKSGTETEASARVGTTSSRNTDETEAAPLISLDSGTPARKKSVSFAPEVVKFEFTIPATVDGHKETTGTPVAPPPKLIFDFGGKRSGGEGSSMGEIGEGGTGRAPSSSSLSLAGEGKESGKSVAGTGLATIPEETSLAGGETTKRQTPVPAPSIGAFSFPSATTMIKIPSVSTREGGVAEKEKTTVPPTLGLGTGDSRPPSFKPETAPPGSGVPAFSFPLASEPLGRTGGEPGPTRPPIFSFGGGSAANQVPKEMVPTGSETSKPAPLFSAPSTTVPAAAGPTPSFVFGVGSGTVQSSEPRADAVAGSRPLTTGAVPAFTFGVGTARPPTTATSSSFAFGGTTMAESTPMATTVQTDSKSAPPPSFGLAAATDKSSGPSFAFGTLGSTAATASSSTDSNAAVKPPSGFSLGAPGSTSFGAAFESPVVSIGAGGPSPLPFGSGTGSGPFGKTTPSFSSSAIAPFGSAPAGPSSFPASVAAPSFAVSTGVPGGSAPAMSTAPPAFSFGASASAAPPMQFNFGGATSPSNAAPFTFGSGASTGATSSDAGQSSSSAVASTRKFSVPATRRRK